MILNILMYTGIYLLFGFFIATPLFLWLTKDRLDDCDKGAVIMLVVGFPIFFALGFFHQLYLIGKQFYNWYFKFLQRIAR